MVQLFGGALEMTLPVGDFLDVSHVRQVPDNQEVFVDKHSDLSIIVELLEHDPSMSVEQHFEVLSEDNGAQSSDVLTVTGNCLYGTLTASKFNKTDAVIVHIYLGLQTVDGHNTDILISMNSPGKQTISFEKFTEMFKSLTVKDPSIFCTE